MLLQLGDKDPQPSSKKQRLKYPTNTMLKSQTPVAATRSKVSSLSVVLHINIRVVSKRASKFIQNHVGIKRLLPNTNTPVRTKVENGLFAQVVPAHSKREKADYKSMALAYNQALIHQALNAEVDAAQEGSGVEQALVNSISTKHIKDFHHELD